MDTSSNGKLKVLVACEYSGIVRDAFIRLGHDAISCDLLPTDQPGPHHKGDVTEILYQDWDLIIAHPPCTFITNSSVIWFKKRPERWAQLDEACKFFNLFLNHPCPRICIENPIPHKYAIERLNGRKYDQIVQPYEFGHPESKRTCFWLKGLPKLKETDNVKDIYLSLPKKQAQRIHYLPPSKDRWKLRSTTFQGIADAMASQWSIPQHKQLKLEL